MPAVTQTYKCKTCGHRSPEGNYHKYKSKLDGRYLRRLHCKPCFNKKGRQWHESKCIEINGVRRSYQTIRSKYGMTLDDYVDMFENQEGVCAICKEIEYGQMLVVDHDHATGKVRGLLCHRCNNGLGYVKDSFVIIESMKNYLEAHNARSNS